MVFNELDLEFWTKIALGKKIENFNEFYKKLPKKDKKQVAEMLLGVHPLIKTNKAVEFYYKSGLYYSVLKVEEAIQNTENKIKFSSNDTINGEIEPGYSFRTIMYKDLFNIAKITGYSNFKRFNVLRFDFEKYEDFSITLDYCHLFEITSKKFKNYMVQQSSEYLTLSFVLVEDMVIEHFKTITDIRQRMYLADLFFVDIYSEIKNIYFYIPQNIKVYLASMIDFGLYSHHIQKWSNERNILMNGKDLILILYNSSKIIKEQQQFFKIERRKEIVVYDEN